jgi:AraC-like DNA-binding protein
MSEDVLSDVLRAVRLTGAVYFDYRVRGPWVGAAPASRDIAPLVMPGVDRVIEFHLIARGSCWAQADGLEPVRLREGDLLLFPQGDAHVISSAPGLRGTPDRATYVRGPAALPLVHELGGSGPEEARIICGFLGCDDRPFNPLLAALPRMLHVPATIADWAGGWIGALTMSAVKEASQPRPGSENVLARLSELMFVETIRRYLETLPPGESGWLAGLRDPVVGRALGALHGAPAEPWTVESLARRVGASRSVLAERFTALVGQPPMQYLALWRMQAAARQLLDGAGVAEVAAAVGYESEAAFSRAFKKLLGRAPATWRRAVRSGGRAAR